MLNNWYSSVIFWTSPWWVLILPQWYHSDSLWYLLVSCWYHSNPWWIFSQNIGLNLLVMIWWFGFHLFLTTLYGELRTIIETVWMRVFPCDNPGSGRTSYVNIFRDRRIQWSVSRCVMLPSLFIQNIIIPVMEPKVKNLLFSVMTLWWTLR